MNVVEKILHNDGFSEIAGTNKQKVWEKQVGDSVYRIMFPFQANTFYFYEYTKALKPVSFLEFHNYTTDGQVERLKKILP